MKAQLMLGFFFDYLLKIVFVNNLKMLEDKDEKITVCTSCGTEIESDTLVGDDVLSICPECNAIENTEVITRGEQERREQGLNEGGDEWDKALATLQPKPNAHVIVSLSDLAALDFLEMIKEKGPEAVIKELSKWHTPESKLDFEKFRSNFNWDIDNQFSKDGYTLVWNDGDFNYEMTKIGHKPRVGLFYEPEQVDNSSNDIHSKYMNRFDKSEYSKDYDAAEKGLQENKIKLRKLIRESLEENFDETNETTYSKDDVASFVWKAFPLIRSGKIKNWAQLHSWFENELRNF
jgi:predicted RNA-binding Zn-ribbon protein involved in translation (DUF1610 family)